jgi:16S rRNA (guanine527-N7)-methyltransferase
MQQLLQNALAQMGLAIPDLAQQQILRYIENLDKWNKAFNLTAVRAPEQMLTHHILDSLSLLTHLNGTEIKTVLDVGTGPGLPGIPLAICRPEIKFTLIDSQQKKINFVQHVITSLQLPNVIAVHERIEKLQRIAPIDMVISRAFASLQEYVNLIANVCDSNTKIVAMKGRKAQALDEQLQLPAAFKITRIQDVIVPGLNAERCLVFLQKQGD